MMDLKTFAMPFGLLVFAAWVWLLWPRVAYLFFAFGVTMLVAIVMHKHDDIAHIVFEPQRVLVEMRKKVDEVRRLAEAVGELTAYNIANLWRFAPEDPEAARLAERD